MFSPMRIFLYIILLSGVVLGACTSRELQRLSTNHLGGTDRVEGRYVHEEGELVRIELADGYIGNPLAEMLCNLT